MSNLYALIGAGIIGICVALEPIVNGGLGKYITLRLAAFHSFFVGLILFLAINLFTGSFKEYHNIIKAPPYLWIGGLLGGIIVYLGAKVTPVIGIASTITIMVAVQLITSIVIDTAGFFGIQKVPLDFGRILGVVILIIAVKLIVK